MQLSVCICLHQQYSNSNVMLRILFYIASQPIISHLILVMLGSPFIDTCPLPKFLQKAKKFSRDTPEFFAPSARYRHSRSDLKSVLVKSGSCLVCCFRRVSPLLCRIGLVASQIYPPPYNRKPAMGSLKVQRNKLQNNHQRQRIPEKNTVPNLHIRLLRSCI